MGKVFTDNGISLNFAGTAQIVAQTSNLFFGPSENAFIGYATAGSGTFVLECLDKNWSFNVDDGIFKITAQSGTILFNIGTASSSIIRFTAGSGTIATLDSSGNLLLKGTVGTAAVF